MSEIEAYVDKLSENENVRVFGICKFLKKNGREKITANKEITHPTRNGDDILKGQTFSLDRVTGETDTLYLYLLMQDLNCEAIDLDEVETRVLINLKWPKSLNYEITQTRSGWEFKFDLESLSSETQTRDVVQAGITCVSVGAGNSG